MSRTYGAKPHRLDGAGRLKLRDEERRDLGDKVVLTNGLDGCVDIFSPPSWEKYAAALDRLPVNNRKARRLRRLVRDAAEDCEVDGQGRLRIPETFLKWAGLDKEHLQARLTHAGDRWELWEEERYWESLSEAAKMDDETQAYWDAASLEEEVP